AHPGKAALAVDAENVVVFFALGQHIDPTAGQGFQVGIANGGATTLVLDRARWNQALVPVRARSLLRRAGNRRRRGRCRSCLVDFEGVAARSLATDLLAYPIDRVG